mmetsp:Transcript_52928/g.124262  ORF Transcript_52928/g.124262 Transcript_52928/m.124262 type:complete len:228 (-) Transcript_52928:172-855(-)
MPSRAPRACPNDCQAAPRHGSPSLSGTGGRVPAVHLQPVSRGCPRHPGNWPCLPGLGMPAEFGTARFGSRPGAARRDDWPRDAAFSTSLAIGSAGPTYLTSRLPPEGQAGVRKDPSPASRDLHPSAILVRAHPRSAPAWQGQIARAGDTTAPGSTAQSRGHQMQHGRAHPLAPPSSEHRHWSSESLDPSSPVLPETSAPIRPRGLSAPPENAKAFFEVSAPTAVLLT